MKASASRTKLKEHRVVAKNGDVAYVKIATTFSEVLQEYINAGHPLVGLNFTNKDLTGIVFPDGSDVSDCDFTNSVLNDVVAKNKCKFEYCLFSETKASGFTFTEASFLGSEFVGADFKYGHMKFAKFSDTKISSSSFLRMRGYKSNFDGAVISDTKFLQSGLALSSWKKSTVIQSSFNDTEFVPIKMAMNAGKGERKKVADKDKNRNSALFLESLFEGANFIGCTYENARVPDITNFPSEFKRQVQTNALVRAISGVGAYVVFERIAEYAKDDIHNFAAHSHIFHGLIQYAPNVQPELSAVVLISAIAAAFGIDKARDRFNEYTRNSGAEGLKKLTIARLNMKERLGALSDLVVLTGSGRTMSYIKAALIASSMSWKWHGRSMIYKRNFMSFFNGREKILVCHKEHLQDAMDVLARLENKSNKYIQKITFIAPEIKDRMIVSISLSENRHARAVYKAKSSSPEFDGHIVLFWDQYGRTRNATSVPVLDSAALKKIIGNDEQLKSIIANGQSAALRAMVDGVAPKQQIRPEAAYVDSAHIEQNDGSYAGSSNNEIDVDANIVSQATQDSNRQMM